MHILQLLSSIFLLLSQYIPNHCLHSSRKPLFRPPLRSETDSSSANLHDSRLSPVSSNRQSFSSFHPPFESSQRFQSSPTHEDTPESQPPFFGRDFEGYSFNTPQTLSIPRKWNSVERESFVTEFLTYFRYYIGRQSEWNASSKAHCWDPYPIHTSKSCWYEIFLIVCYLNRDFQPLNFKLFSASLTSMLCSLKFLMMWVMNVTSSYFLHRIELCLFRLICMQLPLYSGILHWRFCGCVCSYWLRQNSHLWIVYHQTYHSLWRSPAIQFQDSIQWADSHAIIPSHLLHVYNHSFLSSVAPIKALCSERYEDWKHKFSPLGIRCLELTGDTEIEDYYELQESHLIFTTPVDQMTKTASWILLGSIYSLISIHFSHLGEVGQSDQEMERQQVSCTPNSSLPRRWGIIAHFLFTFISPFPENVFGSFWYNQVHLLSDEARGATMEAVVSRMKTVQTAVSHSVAGSAIPNQGIRFVAVSATIPNVEDVSDTNPKMSVPSLPYVYVLSCFGRLLLGWALILRLLFITSQFYVHISDITCNISDHDMNDHMKVGFLCDNSCRMDESCRPVRLRKVVLGYPCPENMSEFRFDLSLNYKLALTIQTYSEGKPTLVVSSESSLSIL